MAQLRRRFASIFSASTSDSPPSSSSSSSTAIDRQQTAQNTATDGDDATAKTQEKDQTRKIEEVSVKRGRKRRNGLVFTLGGIFGVFVALFFANQNEVISLDALMDLNLDSLIDVIPAGIIKDAKEFSVCAKIF